MTSSEPSHFRKLPARYAGIVLPLLLSVFMSFLISGITTVRTIGLSPDFFGVWMSNWGLSWVVAFPTVLVVMPIVRRLVAMIVDVPKGFS